MTNEGSVAIMQPYLFPYIGYFQLINAVDTFVLYDDVSFIKQGWINRNQILNNNKPLLFSLPLESISSYKKICNTKINQTLYKKWCFKFEKLVEASYKKAKKFSEVSRLLQSVLQNDYTAISELNNNSIRQVCNYIGIDTNIKSSEGSYGNEHLQGQERVIDICKKEGASSYINSFGGNSLYSKDAFAHHHINLHFIKPELTEYKQFNLPFVPGLSVIDVLMFNEKHEIAQLLNNYTLE